MKTNKSLIVTITLALGLFSVSSCKDLEFKKTKGGMPYKIYSGNGDKPVKTGSYLKYHITTKLNDSVLFDSHWGTPGYFRVDGAQSPYNITEVIMNLKKGDSVYAVQMVDTLLKHNPNGFPPQFKKGDRLITLLKVLDIIDSTGAYMADMESERELKAKSEIKEIEDYLSKKNIKAEQTPAGTFVEIISSGNGPRADTGTVVSVMYTGKTFEGKTFDSNVDTTFHHTDPLRFTIGQHAMITGFEDGLKLLKKGSKARLYIPSMQAWGGNPGQGSIIKPFENVIFDIDLVDVVSEKPAPVGGNQ